MTITPNRHRTPASADLLVSTPKAGTTTGRVVAVLRIAFGLTFLWAFVDKLFGLGYATPAGKGWIDGGDPTAGFLKGARDRSPTSTTPWSVTSGSRRCS